MNTKDASGLEVYGRNYRTMTIGCILCAKLWEGWQILQNCYFSQEMHKQFESLYSNEGKASLVALKKYFANGKKTIVYKIRNSTFHYPKTEDEKNKLERRCNDTDENDYSEHFIAENCHNSLFSTDHFVANFVDKTNSKNVRESIKALNLDVKMLTKHFYQFLSEYILCFQKKCTFSKEQIHLENVPAMKDV